MNIFDALLLSMFGFAVAVPSSMIGVGGGFLIVPVLILIFQLPAQNAIAISLVAICGTTISATVAYVKQKRIDYKLGLLYDVLDVPGVAIGAYFTTLLPSNWLTGMVGFFLVSLSILFMIRREDAVYSTKQRSTKIGSKIWTRRKIDSSGKPFEYRVIRPGLALFSSFAGGLVTGVSGLGGGITDTTTMIMLGVPPHIAVASSEFAMALTNGAGVVAHGILNNILIDYALLITVGTIIGAQVGSLLAKRVKGRTLRKLLCIIALLVGLRLILLTFL